jgi:hypothetical protein
LLRMTNGLDGLGKTYAEGTGGRFVRERELTFEQDGRSRLNREFGVVGHLRKMA